MLQRSKIWLLGGLQLVARVRARLLVRAKARTTSEG